MTPKPAPVAQAIESLVSALAESRGWMRDYSRAIIEDAIEREQPDGVQAQIVRSKAAGFLMGIARDLRNREDIRHEASKLADALAAPGSAKWCDREGGCFCEFRNEACSNYVGVPAVSAQGEQHG